MEATQLVPQAWHLCELQLQEQIGEAQLFLGASAGTEALGRNAEPVLEDRQCCRA